MIIPPRHRQKSIYQCGFSEETEGPTEEAREGRISWGLELGLEGRMFKPFLQISGRTSGEARKKKIQFVGRATLPTDAQAPSARWERGEKS